jgi:hypothetical protein
MAGMHHHTQLLVKMGVSQTPCPVWSLTVILLISASQVGRITDVSHWHMTGTRIWNNRHASFMYSNLSSTTQITTDDNTLQNDRATQQNHLELLIFYETRCFITSLDHEPLNRYLKNKLLGSAGCCAVRCLCYSNLLFTLILSFIQAKCCRTPFKSPLILRSL